MVNLRCLFHIISFSITPSTQTDSEPKVRKKLPLTIKTEINSEPAFVTQDIDMIYMGPMTEIFKKLQYAN